VASIYSEVLNRKRVSVHDGFFDLGGQSLLAIKVRSRVLDTFGIEVPARRVFDLPTVALLSEFIDSVRQQDNAGCQLPPLVPVTQCGARPLSFAQQRLFFLEQHEDSRAMFNMSGALCLRGHLDPKVLRASLAEIVNRHEVLRTTYKTTEAGPLQSVEVKQDLLLDTLDISHHGIDEQSKKLQRITAGEALAPFTLESGPLIRLKLIRCRKEAVRVLDEGGELVGGNQESDDEFHILLLTVHHIAFDGWSIAIFFRELSELYRALIEERASTLPELPIQYSDFACWQRRWLVPGNTVYEAHLEYWRNQLHALPVLEIPKNRPRPGKPSLRGARYATTLSTSVVDEMRSLCTSANCTLFVGLLAGFNVLLSRLSGQNEIVIGTDVANRTRTETENLIGFFVNQLVLRTSLNGSHTFRDLLARSREVVLGAEAHQDLPFDRLVEALRPERRTNRMPLFQVKLVYGDTPPSAFGIPGLQTSLLEIDTGATQLDLILFLVDTPKGLRMTFEYCTDLFDKSTIVQIADQYARLIAGLTNAADVAMNSLEVRTDMESNTQTVARRKRPSIDLERLRNGRVSTPDRNGTAGFRVDTPLSEGALPGVLVPANGHRDLATVAGSHRDFVESQLIEHGAILFRGFDAGSVPAFDKFTKGICAELFMENGEHPRENISGTVYTPVFFSPERKLLWHNENTFNYRWPQKIWFCCVQPAEQGGETPIVDSRRVYQRMDPAIRDRFMSHGITYIRNYGDGPGLSWQRVFRTEDRANVERYCRENLIEFEWKGGDRLRTRSTRPAAVRHPITGEYCWINQAQHWHLSCLDDQTREALRAIFADEDLPRTCCFGDGSPISDADMQSICQLYRDLEVSFPWQRDDVLMVDNIFTAHARNAFSGERKLLVAMGELRSYADFSN
jgi:alpha-ketoglutarate-dependent taurine dioxygenase